MRSGAGLGPGKSGNISEARAPSGAAGLAGSFPN